MPHARPPGQLRWRLGTMGFSYSDWAGRFYPAGVRPGDYLRYYASRFDAVELDTTFYATPPHERVERWASVVPDDFRFCVKMTRAVTHDPLPRSALPVLRDFVHVCRGFGQKLGVILLQFPPTFAAAQFDQLAAVVDALPADLFFAVEIRHPSWFEPEHVERAAALLRSRSMSWACADLVGMPPTIVRTADWLYVRFIGQHNRFKYLGEEQLDVTDDLMNWKSRLDDLAAAGVRGIYGFFNNDYAGFSVATADRFKRMIGLEVKSGEPIESSGQRRLF